MISLRSGVVIVGILVVAVCTGWLLFPFRLPIKSEILQISDSLKGKRILITGASQGIGRCIAEELSKFSILHLVIVARSRSKLLDVKKSMERNLNSTHIISINLISADLSSKTDCSNVIEKAAELMGGLDMIILNHITNAQYGLWWKQQENLETQYLERVKFLQDIFQVNTFSYIWLATASIKYLTASKGQIVVVSSLAGHVGTPMTAAYSATKHALHGFFNAFRIELGLQNTKISITLCSIGATETEGAKYVQEKMTSVQWDSPTDAALAIIQGASRRQREIFHPHHKVFPTIILYNIMPGFIDWILSYVAKSTM
mmetsp:Transcript_12530/g.18785  ORF Transcript_12530/g.18785 Transcript_12530/m.18785 type:complete len:316 (-) Transcript_12530:97-1044(-)